MHTFTNAYTSYLMSMAMIYSNSSMIAMCMRVIMIMHIARMLVMTMVMLAHCCLQITEALLQELESLEMLLSIVTKG
jgi:hypothetical protein